MRVLCLAHVTNTMGQTDDDIEKGEADGTREALAARVRRRWIAAESLPASRRVPGLSGLTGLDVTQQAMLTRSFPVDVAARPEGTTAPCRYLVHYPGPEEDMNA